LDPRRGFEEDEMKARRMWILSSLISVLSLWGTPGCIPEGVSYEAPDAGELTGAGTGGDTSGPSSSTGGAPQTGGVTGAATGGATVQPPTAQPPGTGGAPNGTGGRTGDGTGGRGTGGVSASGGRTATGGAAMTGGRGGAMGVGTGGAIVTGNGGAAVSAPGEIIFTGDFETGDLSQWAYVERCATDRILVYNTANMPAGAPPPRQGQYAARFHVLDTDVAPCTSTENPRAEVETPESLFKPGDERWEAWSMYLPSTLPAPLQNQGWFVFQEDYGAPWDGSPSIGWNLDLVNNPKRFRMDRGEQYGHDQPGSASMILGHWVDFLVHKKFANTASGGGFIEVWVDGMPISFNASGCANCTRLMMQTMHSSQKSVGFYLNAYRERGFFSSFDVYYDAVRIGTTRAAVELPR
jgi:hypothetical protein